MIEIQNEHLCICVVILLAFVLTVVFIFVRKARQRHVERISENKYQMYSLMSKHKGGKVMDGQHAEPFLMEETSSMQRNEESKRTAHFKARTPSTPACSSTSTSESRSKSRDPASSLVSEDVLEPTTAQQAELTTRNTTYSNSCKEDGYDYGEQQMSQEDQMKPLSTSRDGQASDGTGSNSIKQFSYRSYEQLTKVANANYNLHTDGEPTTDLELQNKRQCLSQACSALKCSGKGQTDNFPKSLHDSLKMHRAKLKPKEGPKSDEDTEKQHLMDQHMDWLLTQVEFNAAIRDLADINEQKRLFLDNERE